MANAPEVSTASTAIKPVRPKRVRTAKRDKVDNNVDALVSSTQAGGATGKKDTASGVDTERWSYVSLKEGNAVTCPVLFSEDSSYAFITSSTVVKIYSTSTAVLLSTLSPPSSPSPVTSLLLNPANPLQLVVGSTNGLLRLWDFVEGTLLRTLDLGSGIQFACGNPSLPDQIFVALSSNEGITASMSTTPAGIYSISLKPSALPANAIATSPSTPRTTSRRMRLSQPRIIRSLALSSTGTHLISLNPTTINICETANLSKGFEHHLELEDDSEEIISIAFHPSENYFATGMSNGKIRVWYNALTTGTGKTRASSSVLHWHTSPVASLTFTPNGAYLLSGAAEAVLVLWQLSSSHKEYVPRLGASITALSVTKGGEGEQEVVVRLGDGTVVFVGSQRLKIGKRIEGLKANEVNTSTPTDSSLIPLAVQPLSNSLVLPASHPSSLQFYSPVSHSQIGAELEISPSNRVSSTSTTTVEPTRVTKVAFSSPAKVGGSSAAAGGYWMATVDEWSSGSFATERMLKFWRYLGDGTKFVLTTRIDRPHDSTMTSLSFSPSSSSPLLLTTSLDGSIKLWSYLNSSWRCRSSLSYRSFTPVSASWSSDGSMFAVAYPRCITLWSLASGVLIHAFACEGIAPATSVEFGGAEGDLLIAGGKHGTMVWDLMTLEETFNMTLEVKDLAVKPSSSVFIATESSSSSSKDPSKATPSNSFIIDTSASPMTCEVHTLPFGIQQTTWFSTNRLLTISEDITMAVVNDKQEVILVGEGVAQSRNSSLASEQASKLPSSTAGQSRLFDEIFGAKDTTVVKKVEEIKISEFNPKSSKALAVLDVPAHTLPPARLLWRSMLSGFSIEKKGKKDGTANGKMLEAIEGDYVEMPDEEKTSSSKVAFTNSPDSLVEIFKARMSLEAEPVKTVTPIAAVGKFGKSPGKSPRVKGRGN